MTHHKLYLLVLVNSLVMASVCCCCCLWRRRWRWCGCGHCCAAWREAWSHLGLLKMEANDDPTINMAFAVGRTPFIVNLIPCEDSRRGVAFGTATSLVPASYLSCRPTCRSACCTSLPPHSRACGRRGRRAAIPCSRCMAAARLHWSRNLR